MEYIYIILNLVNGKFYIGRTNNPGKRKTQHFSALRGNRHHCVKLQRAYQKYAESNFVFVVIETCGNSIKREQEILNTINYKDSYNISKSSFGASIGKDNMNWKGGKGICCCGNKMNPRAKYCIECTNKSGINNPFFNKEHSEESKKLISDKRKEQGYIGGQERKVIINNIEYKSVSDAARNLNVAPNTIINRIRNSKFENYSYKLNA